MVGEELGGQEVGGEEVHVAQTVEATTDKAPDERGPRHQAGDGGLAVAQAQALGPVVVRR